MDGAIQSELARVLRYAPELARLAAGTLEAKSEARGKAVLRYAAEARKCAAIAILYTPVVGTGRVE